MNSKQQKWIRCPARESRIIITALMVFALGTAAYCQTPGGSQDLQQIVKLAQAHISDDNIITYIKTSGATFSLSADDVLYLNGQGVSQQVISALLQAKPPQVLNPQSVVVATAFQSAPSLPSSPPVSSTQFAVPVSASGSSTAPPSDAVNFAYFKEELNPYGQWHDDISTNGTCWVPNELQTNPNWRPYVDHGNWTYTDDGWFWKSDYPWGEIVFHYGRWFNEMTVRWAWTPGYDWGPAWVSWRGAAPSSAGSPAAVGWAPLPPAAQFETGVGIEYNGVVADTHVDFGLPPSAYVYIDAGHFWDPDVSAAVIFDPIRLAYIGDRGMVHNDFSFDQGRFKMNGLGNKVFVLTHHDFRLERVEIRNTRIARAKDMQVNRFRDRHDSLVQSHDPRVIPDPHPTDRGGRGDDRRGGGGGDDRRGNGGGGDRRGSGGGGSGPVKSSGHTTNSGKTPDKPK